MPAKPDAKKLLDDALQMEPTARAFIAETLLDSLDMEQDFPVSQEWLDEIRRRCDEIDSGKTPLLDGAMVINELRVEGKRFLEPFPPRQAFSGVMNGLSQITAMEEAVKSSDSAVQGNRIGYRVGTRLNVDVLNVEQQLYAARRDLSRARYETLMQGLRLQAAAGRLGVDDLKTVDTLLKP